MRKEFRVAAGIAAGDRVEVQLARDEAPREIDVPEDFARALQAEKDANEAYARLSFTHRKEYVRWITEAKREATRAARIEKAVTMLREGVRMPDAPSARG